MSDTLKPVSAVAIPVEPAPEAPAPAALSRAELVRRLQSIDVYAARKAFYEAHPVLRTIIDPCNFSS